MTEPVTPILTPPNELQLGYVGFSKLGANPSSWRFQVNSSDGRSHFLKIGDVVAGWTVVRGDDKVIILEKNGRETTLTRTR